MSIIHSASKMSFLIFSSEKFAILQYLSFNQDCLQILNKSNFIVFLGIIENVELKLL